VIEEVERRGGRIETIEISHEADRRSVEFTIELPREHVASQVVAGVADVEHVLEVRWAD
jgi:hypothetical protein